MPYMPLINSAQHRTTRGIEPTVHHAKSKTLLSTRKNIASVSNNPTRLTRCLCRTINIINSGNSVCLSGLVKITACCLHIRQHEPTASPSTFLPRQYAKNESAIDKPPHAVSQLNPEFMVQSGKCLTLGLQLTATSPIPPNHNHLEINSHNRLNAWNVLLKEYEKFSFDKQNSIYDHIMRQLVDLTPAETQRLVDLLEKLILKKSYACPTCHHMEEMYMAAFKSLEKKSFRSDAYN